MYKSIIFLFFITLPPLNAFSASETCIQFYGSNKSLNFDVPNTSLHWAQSIVDKLGPYGIRNFTVNQLLSFGVRPKYIYRGLGSVFVLRPEHSIFDREQISQKADHLQRKMNSISTQSVSRDEKNLVNFLISQVRFSGSDHNFNPSLKIALSWAELMPQFQNEKQSDDGWAFQVLQGLQSLKFILRTELPKSKHLFRDDTGTEIGAGKMTILESAELNPDQITNLVYRVKYHEKWYRPDGPIKKVWLPLFTFNQKSAEFLINADQRMSPEEIVRGIRRIYSEVAGSVP